MPVSLDTDFQLKLTVLIFANIFAQKGYFQSKTEPWDGSLVVSDLHSEIKGSWLEYSC